MDKNKITKYLILTGVILICLMALSFNLFLWLKWVLVVKIIAAFLIPLGLVWIGLNWSTKEEAVDE